MTKLSSTAHMLWRVTIDYYKFTVTTPVYETMIMAYISSNSFPFQLRLHLAVHLRWVWFILEPANWKFCREDSCDTRKDWLDKTNHQWYIYIYMMYKHHNIIKKLLIWHLELDKYHVWIRIQDPFHSRSVRSKVGCLVNLLDPISLAVSLTKI